MKNATAMPYPIEFIKCSNGCKTEWRVDHIVRGAGFGTWSCDNCGVVFDGKRLLNGLIEIEIDTTQTVHKFFVLLKQHKAEACCEDVYLVVYYTRRMLKDRPGLSQDAIDSIAYLYDEHMCSSDLLGVEQVIATGDTDPHGLFQFVAIVPWKETQNPFELFEKILEQKKL